MHRIVEACDTTIGRRDLALVITGFHFASRTFEVGGLPLAGHHRPRLCHEVKVAVVSGKTECSIRTVKIRRRRSAAARVPRHRPMGEHRRPFGPSAPDSDNAAVARIAQRSGVPLHGIGHGLRSGLATDSRRNWKGALDIAEQGGWAKNGKAMMGHIRCADGGEGVHALV
ncbi:hypothetical protein L1I79_31870 [Strepomyces sp. STD 3.1]|nr:hypothetical protein [Streptomyces sp. STD 3.1]